MKSNYCNKLLFLALFVVACGENPGVALPEVPVVSTTQMRAVARQQIEKAYADAARKPKDIAAVAELALVLHAYGYDAAAEIAYRRSLALRPNDVRLIYLRSLVVQQLGRSDEALAGYRSMTGDEEFGARAWARIADIQLMNGDWREALTAADAGLHTVSGDSELRYLRGRALAELGEIEAADAVFREVLDSGAQQP